MGVTKPYEFIWFGDIHGPKPYEFIEYGQGADTETPYVGAGSLSFCPCWGFSVVLLWFPAGFPTPLGLF